MGIPVGARPLQAAWKRESGRGSEEGLGGDGSLGPIPVAPISFQAAKALIHRTVKDPPPEHVRIKAVYQGGPPDRLPLSRSEFTQLSQLRSGHSLLLAAYRTRLNPDLDPTCPRCGEEPESLEHIVQRCQASEALRVDCFGHPSPPALGFGRPPSSGLAVFPEARTAAPPRAGPPTATAAALNMNMNLYPESR